MEQLDKQTQTELEAAAFRRLLKHLDDNKDVQNIDLMILADFCRNCLSKWLVTAAEERHIELDLESAREHVYGMPYSEWKANHQSPATDEQLRALEARQKEKENASS
ncbi:DUF1244 domain-containing protein [Kushneria indalinina]|uniref:SMc04008-like domain-containing protein n=1 Tax=Kushneria indalinina DSM 14324 TaxID=1122140 RepID=A0A3D9DZX6_9GAMM|nr:DUF1244 domain-containing protein [Kushneria indalinina]REC96205.1 hypothetical protein C8D72_0885 [Kushneria indalinina DSM 14324]